jgi:CRISPR-associated endonuclease/helicase Cas3
MLSPAVLEGYFKRLISDEETKGTLRYPLTSKDHGINGNLLDLLGSNDMGRGAYKDHHAQKEYPGAMAQAFATAGRHFTPLDACTYPVLTPWGKGAEIIRQLQTEKDIRTTRALLRQAQPYSVAVYKHDLDLLLQNHALSLLPDASVYVLEPAYYQAELGLTTQRQLMEPLYS